MKALRIAIVAWMLTTIAGAADPANSRAESAAPPAASEPGPAANTCLVRIDYDPQTLALTSSMAEQLFQVVAEKAYRRVDNSPSGAGTGAALTFRVLGSQDGMAPGSPMMGGGIMPGAPGMMGGGGGRGVPGFAPGPAPSFPTGTIVGVLELRWEESGLPIPSQKFWTALCEEISAVLAKASSKESDLTAQELARARAEMASAQERMQQLQELNRQLCERAGISDLAQVNVVRELADMERQQENLRSEVEAATARRTAIESEIARVGQAIDVKKDEIGTELRRIVELREAQVERGKQLLAVGQAPATSAEAPQQALAEAKIQLLRHQEELRRAAGGEQLGRLTGELSGVTISLQEKQAVLAYVSKRLADMKAKNLPEIADLYDREVAWQLPMARERAERARRQLDELEQRVGARRTPGVTMLDAN